MGFLSLVFSTRCHPLIYLRDVTTKSLSFIQCLSWRRYCWWEPRTKPYVWFVMLRWNAIVILINLWKHFISRIRRHDFHNEWMADGAVCLLHILKRGRCSLCFQPLPSISTQISSPAALRVTSLALYHLIWENYRHITYTAALSSSRQLIKNKSLV